MRVRGRVCGSLWSIGCSKKVSSVMFALSLDDFITVLVFCGVTASWALQYL